jgi:hypothetical protein
MSGADRIILDELFGRVWLIGESFGKKKILSALSSLASWIPKRIVQLY